MNKPDPNIQAFNEGMVIELYKVAVREWTESDDDVGSKLARIFRETFARIDFDTRTVHATIDDPPGGPLSEATISFAIIAIRFGVYLASQGIELVEESFVRSDH
jgi:hypothetical protein